MLVLAGPGSGKTHVISQRIRYLIEKYGVDPTCILTITFTKAAASEMKRRCVDICPRAGAAVFGTFHSVFYHFLRKSERYQKFTLINEKQKKQIVQKLLPLKDKTELQKKYAVEIMLQRISRYKNSQIESEETDSTFKNVFEQYCHICYEQELLDFDDMILLCQKMFDECPQEREKWQKRFLYVLVDEFQDVNGRQYELTKQLVARNGNLFVVGDDDQAIYSFRGADPGYMKRFSEDFPDCKTICLEENFRCGSRIVAVSSESIGNNGQRFLKTIRSSVSYEDSVIFQSFETREKEMEYLSEIILKFSEKQKQENILPDKPITTAVLVRTNQQAEYIAEILRYENIDCIVREKRRCFYENIWVQDILAVLRFATQGYNRRDLIVFMNKPYRGLTRNMLKSEKVDLHNIYENAVKIGQKEVAEDINKLEKQCRILQNMDAYGAILFVLRGMKYQSYMEETADGEESIWEHMNVVICELEERARRFQNVSDFLKYADSYVSAFAEGEQKKNDAKLSQDNQSEPENMVQIMTYHASKGLEFDRVFLPMLCNGIVPHGHMLNTEQMEEERRMFYVAVTRAKKELYLSWYGKEPDKDASLFIREIKKGCSKEQPGDYSSSSNSALSRYSSKASETASYSASSSMKKSSGSAFGSLSSSL